MIELNKNLLTENQEYAPIRTGFGIGLKEAASENKSIVALCADLTDSTKMSDFKNAFPDRFVEMGIQEQSMASVASGMAAMGKTPFIASYAMFNPGRNWEQIRTTICYNNVPVKVVGAHAGVSVGPDGGTHQAIEDIALMRVIPRMTVLVPCDSEEARKATIATSKSDFPAYIRLAREKTPIITSELTPFEIGKGQVFFQSSFVGAKKILFIACGQMVYQAIMSAKSLEAENISSTVINMATIKPLDTNIISSNLDVDLVVTAEEHQRMGGLGSAVSEYISQNNPKKMLIIGVDDEFGQSGTPDELMEFYGLTHNKIIEKIKGVI